MIAQDRSGIVAPELAAPPEDRRDGIEGDLAFRQLRNVMTTRAARNSRG